MNVDLFTNLLATDWHGMLVPTLSIAEKILRTVLVFLFLVIVLRLAGKREITALNSFDFIVLLVLSNTLQNAVIGNDNSVVGGFVGAATLLAINWAVNRFVLGHKRWEKLLVGKKRFLIVSGKIVTGALHKELITLQELEMAAHKQGIQNLSEVESAEIDPDGELFFVARTPTPDVLRHRELLERLDALAAEVAGLKNQLGIGGQN